MARRSHIIHTKSGNATVGRVEQHGGGDDNDVGSGISLLLLNDKGIHNEGLFLYLDRPRGGVTVAAEIMVVRARVGGQVSQIGRLGWNTRVDLAFMGRTETTAESGVRKGELASTL